jgi:adenylate cyclase
MGKKATPGEGTVSNDPPKAVSSPTGGTEAAAPTAAPPLGHGHGHHPHIEFKFFVELKQRNVGRVALLYLVACWLILDPVHVVFHMLEVPAWANRLVLILMAIGLPGVLLFAWAFEITPEGLKPTVEVDPGKSIRSLTGRRLDRAIIVVLALALGYFVADKFWLAKGEAVRENVTALQPPAPLAPATIAAPKKSIAVLPFVDMSEKKDQEYFSDGLSEELIDHLSRGQDLKVIARTSSFSFKGKNEDVRAIASKLGVAHLLEGSVRKSGHDLRITAQLIRASDGTHLWSQTYDRNLADIFKVQDEIAGTVAQALKVALSADGSSAEAKPANTEAYNLVLQGNFFKARRTANDMERAIELYRQAIKQQPDYALAWARLGAAYYAQAMRGWAQRENVETARDAVRQALRIDPSLTWAHYTLAGMHMSVDWDWAAAQVEIDRMRQIDPANTFLLPSAVSDLKVVQGQLDEAIEIRRQVLDRDPLDALSLSQLASWQFNAQRFDESAASSRRLIQQSPGFQGAQSQLSLTLLYLGRADEALHTIKQETDEDSRLGTLPFVYWALGRRDESNAALAKRVATNAGDDAYGIAEAYAYRGEVDRATEWLDRAYRQRDLGMAAVKSDLLLRNLRSDPRYRALLVKMKLAD